MKNLFKTLFGLAVASLLLTACSDDESDYPQYAAYVTVVVPAPGPLAYADAPAYYFLSDEGDKIAAGDVSRIGRYKTENEEGVSKDGKRAFIYFNYINQPLPGFDDNVALYQIVDILSKNVEVATTQEEVTAAGDNAMSLEEAKIRGEWLDIAFSLFTSKDAKHKMTLLDNKTVTAPADMPADYQYLEFRQNADGINGSYRAQGYVSYKLGDDYHPAKTGKKGLYIRVNTIGDAVKYYKIEYKAPADGTQRNQKLAPTRGFTIE